MTEQMLRNKDLITRYKTDIDLVAYLDSVGYTPDKKHYSRNWPVMINETTDHRVLVGRNRATNQYFYTNPSDSSDKGTIIELIAVRNQLDLSSKEGWKQLHEYAHALLGDVYFSHHNHVRPRTISDHTRESAVAHYFKLDPLKNTDFLKHERRLTNEVIYAPEFVNKIFNKSFIDNTLQIAGKNTVFPIENDKGIIGIMNRHTNWNQIQGAKDNGVWLSNVLPDVPVKQIIISEAPIDSLSYHQLYPPKIPGEQLYIATAGTLTHNQPRTIQYIINQTNPQTLILANDNDFQGIRNNINLMGKLLMPDQPNNGLTTHINNNKHTNTLLIEYQQTKQFSEKPIDTQELVRRIDELMNRGFEQGEKPATVSLISNRNDLTQIEITFPNIRQLLIRAANLTGELREVGERIQLKRSIENDWNEDVQLTTVKPQLIDQLGIKLTNDQLKELLKTDRSPTVLNRQLDAGKIIQEFTREGGSYLFDRREPTLHMPSHFRGYALTPEDQLALVNEGQLKKRIDTVHPRTNELQSGYLGVDSELNKFVFLHATRLKSNNLNNLSLSETEVKQVIAGGIVTTQKKGKDGSQQPIEVRILAVRGEIVILPVPPRVTPDNQLKVTKDQRGTTDTARLTTPSPAAQRETTTTSSTNTPRQTIKTAVMGKKRSA